MSRFNQSIVPLKRQIRELEFIIARTKVTSWQAVQEIVRAGLADKAFKIGDQFVANYAGVSYAWDVIGIDHDIPTDPQYTHSLTLQTHDCLFNMQFDAPEALYYAETELPAGEHIFTLYDLKYKFTTTQAVPAGGQVGVTAWAGDTYEPTIVTTYQADRTTQIETGLVVTIAESGDDTLLAVNNYARVRYGSNNYIESRARQFLNSDAASFVWEPKTVYDRPSIGAPFSGSGFLSNLDPDLTAVLGAVDKQVARNTATDGGGQDLFSDKVFLLSRVEVFGGTKGTTTGEKAYPYYSALAANATADALAGRIKYLDGSARNWWLRSPYTGNARHPRIVNTSGTVSYYDAVGANGAAPACCIV